MPNEFVARNGVIAPVLTSTVATGTAPLVVASTTQVANLNAATAGTATSATSATTATNIAGGAAGYLHYQSGVGTTGFVGSGTSTQVLHGNGTGIPTWGSVHLQNDVSSFVTEGRGGTGQIAYSVGDLLQASGSTTLARLAAVATGNVLISGGVNTISSWGKVALGTHVSGQLPVANGGTNLASGTSGGILGFTATGTLASSTLLTANALVLGGGSGATPSTPLGTGTTGQVLTATTSAAPTWTNQSSLSVGTATNATNATTSTNIAAGVAGQIPYQTGAGTTGYIASGGNSQVLRGGGGSGNLPSWVNITSLAVGQATNLGGGSGFQVPYQASANNTLFTGPGTSGQMLRGVTSGAPVFGYISSNSFGASALTDGILLQSGGVIVSSQLAATYFEGNLPGGSGSRTGQQSTASAYTIKIISDATLAATYVFNGYTGSNGFQLTTVTSDERTKENIEPEKLGLSFINDLNPVVYSFKENPNIVKHGLIAQDVLPYVTRKNDVLVRTNDDGYLVLDYMSLFSPMIKAIQELSAEVDRLKRIVGEKDAV